MSGRSLGPFALALHGDEGVLVRPAANSATASCRYGSPGRRQTARSSGRTQRFDRGFAMAALSTRGAASGREASR